MNWELTHCVWETARRTSSGDTCPPDLWLPRPELPGPVNEHQPGEFPQPFILHCANPPVEEIAPLGSTVPSLALEGPTFGTGSLPPEMPAFGGVLCHWPNA